MKIKFLKAFNGDSIHIRYNDDKGEKRNILIDGGLQGTYKIDKGPKGKPIFGEIKETIDQIRTNGELIDLLIITHIDQDHIGGILKWFDEDEEAYKLVHEVWFNSGGLIADWLKLEENPDLDDYITPEKTTKTSAKQGIKFGKYIQEKEIWYRNVIIQGEEMKRYGLDFKFLSPTKKGLERLLKEWKKEDPNTKTSAKLNDYSTSLKDHIFNDKFEKDNSIPNESSIAFILTYKDNKLLFTGDAYSDALLKGLNHFKYTEENPLEAKLIKLPHHGSKGNLSYQLLKCIKTDTYIVSSNGDTHQLPDKQLLARLINYDANSKIYFNYKNRMDMIFSTEDKIDYPDFKAIPITEEFEF